jgi:hypothetical protein
MSWLSWLFILMIAFWGYQVFANTLFYQLQKAKYGDSMSWGPFVIPVAGLLYTGFQ